MCLLSTNFTSQFSENCHHAVRHKMPLACAGTTKRPWTLPWDWSAQLPLQKVNIFHEAPGSHDQIWWGLGMHGSQTLFPSDKQLRRGWGGGPGHRHIVWPIRYSDKVHNPTRWKLQHMPVNERFTHHAQQAMADAPISVSNLSQVEDSASDRVWNSLPITGSAPNRHPKQGKETLRFFVFCFFFSAAFSDKRPVVAPPPPRCHLPGRESLLCGRLTDETIKKMIGSLGRASDARGATTTIKNAIFT